jgi:hypothetical protein
MFTKYRYLAFLLISAILFAPSCALFKKKSKDENQRSEQNSFPPEKKSIFSIFKKKKDITLESEIQKNKTERNTKMFELDGYYFDGRSLKPKEIKVIQKQIRKYEKNKPDKWEQNFLAMRQRGYPIHPDTMRRYKGLESRLARQKQSRTRKMERIYRKNHFIAQVEKKKEMKEKYKANAKREKKRMRQLRRKQRTGEYLPFYERWYKKIKRKSKN